MGKTTKIMIREQLVIEEHLFAGARPRDLGVSEHGFVAGRLGDRVVSEHGFAARLGGEEPVSEHGFAAGRRDDRKLAEHGFASRSISLTQSKIPISHPHLVSSVTVQRRPDGTLYLILDE